MTLTDEEREEVTRLFGWVPEPEPLEHMLDAVEAIVAARVAAVSAELTQARTQLAAIKAVLAQRWDWKAGRSLHAALTRALAVPAPTDATTEEA